MTGMLKYYLAYSCSLFPQRHFAVLDSAERSFRPTLEDTPSFAHQWPSIARKYCAVSIHWSWNQARLWLRLTIVLVSANCFPPRKHIPNWIPIFLCSAALNHPNFGKNYLESADALRLITELGWPIPPSFEDILIHAFTNLTATTPSIIEHTLCAILKAIGQHISTLLYSECCVQLCIKHTDALLMIAERHANEPKKLDSGIFRVVPQFVSNVLTGCPSLFEVTQAQNDAWLLCSSSKNLLTFHCRS